MKSLQPMSLSAVTPAHCPLEALDTVIRPKKTEGMKAAKAVSTPYLDLQLTVTHRSRQKPTS